MERVTLEVSLKPFRDNSDDGIRRVVAEILRQWQHLLHPAKQISFLLWTADGSEILDYRGELSDEIDWAKWIGIANEADPQWARGFECLHNRRWPYTENPPVVTYERLRFIVATLKELTRAHFPGRKVGVATILDPGPEFAESSFKYHRHPEIAYGDIMGESQWVHCAAVLNADPNSYAAFPDGIAQGTTLGTFLGRQSQRFLSDLGFDAIWFSNGFGFSLSSWNVTGEVFDGESFNRARVVEVRDNILRFWRDFRRECPDFPIETRGSNLSTAMDLSSDASPVQQIYRGGFGLTAPVNSPWAALNGDYGLELVGWMSHIAELPDGSGVPFRYYIHDPWWLNSPWFDRYGREPHDIYLPLALARINERGDITRPASVSLLTIDDSHGEMPESVPIEVVPHIRRALEDFSDAPGLLTWIYPFDEYHEWTFGERNRVDEVFFGDWFMRAAVNQGFPLNTVVSTGNFLSSIAANARRFASSILVCPVPDEGCDLANALLALLENGGQVLLYGPLRHGDKRLLDALDLQLAPEICGELQLRTELKPDFIAGAAFPTVFEMRPLLSGGGVEATRKDSSSSRAEVVAEVEDEQKRAFGALASDSSRTEVLAQVEDGQSQQRAFGAFDSDSSRAQVEDEQEQKHGFGAFTSNSERAQVEDEQKQKRPFGAFDSSSNRAEVLAEVEDAQGEKRVFCAFTSFKSGGQLAWVRGAFCEGVSKQQSLPVADDPTRRFRAERLMRWVLQRFDCSLRFDKPSLKTPDPLILASRVRGGWYFSGHSPSTNCHLHWRLKFGVPVPVGCDVLLEGGEGTMTLSRSWHRECRVFVEQSEASEVSCREMHSGEIGISRRLVVRGLRQGRVRFFADPSFPNTLRFQLNNAYLGQGTPVPVEEEAQGLFLTAPVSGDLLISW